jgi:hypothetical protein
MGNERRRVAMQEERAEELRNTGSLPLFPAGWEKVFSSSSLMQSKGRVSLL